MTLKAKRYLLLAVAALLLMAGMLLASGATVYAEETSGSCGQLLTWSYDGAGTLTIEGRGDMKDYDVEFETMPWYPYHEEITKVVLPDAITKIGTGAFYHFDKLKSVDLPLGVKTIGTLAFAECPELESVTLPSYLESISSNAFAHCPKLSAVTFPSSLKEIGYGAFSDCVSLKEVQIPQNVEYIGTNPFRGCSGLEKIDVSDYNTKYSDDHECNAILEGSTLISGCNNTKIPSTVTEIGENAFYGCTGLDPDTANFQSREIEQIGIDAFYGCTSLKTLYVPDVLQDIDPSAFNGCGGLESIEVSDLNPYYSDGNGSNVLINKSYDSWDFDETFKNYLMLGCRNSTIPDDVTAIGDSAFRNCTGLTSIEIPESVTRIHAYAFQGSGLTSVTVPDSVDFFSIYVFRDCADLKTATLPEGLEEIPWGTFMDCKSLQSVTFPSTITKIGESAFRGCASLRSFTVPSGITELDSWAFEDCTALASIILPLSVTDIGYAAFNGCTALRDVYYAGTEDEWEDISISSDNDPLKNATIHYNSDGSNVPHKHAYGPYWSCDETQHWMACSCGDRIQIGAHTFKWVIDKPATDTESGIKHEECTVCGYARSAGTIIEPGTPEVKKNAGATVLYAKLVYNDSSREDNVWVYDDDTFEDLYPGYDYTISWDTEPVEIGTHTFTIDYIGEYSANPSFTDSFDIVPLMGKINSAKAGKKKMTVKWKALKGGVKYQVAYRIKGAWKTKIVAKTSVTLKKLTSKKKYSVKVRAFKDVNGKRYYGAWSVAKKVKIK